MRPQQLQNTAWFRRMVRSWRPSAGAALLTLAGAWGVDSPVRAADEAFVGVLALAVDPVVAKQLELGDELLGRLTKLVDERESEALELALEIKDLPAAERAAKLKPFVTASEAKGLALLSEAQRVRLGQLRIERAGMSSLGDATVAERIGLSAAQREQVAKLLQDRAAAIGVGAEAERRLAQVKFERELATLLSADQRKTWDQLAGLAGAEAKPGEAQPGDAKPAAAKPGDAPAVPDKPAMTAEKPPVERPGEASEPGRGRAAAGDGKLRFNFRFAPWKDVLDWFAVQADLSLVLDTPPPGTFNYTDTRAFTPAEAIDLLNGVLLTKGYTLLRRERLLMLINLEDEIPEPLVDLVSPQELDARGKYELVRCIFPLQKFTPEEAEKEITKLIGPLGRVNSLPAAKQVVVRETAGKLRAIRDVIDAVENPDAGRTEQLSVVQLKYMSTDAFIAAARPLLGLPENALMAPDGSLRLSPDPLNSRILVTGKPERLERLNEIQKLLDVESAKPLEVGDPLEQPQLEVYPTNGADPAAVLQVMQTLMAGAVDIRLAIDPKTGNLVALARPSQHATIRATLEQMQRDASQVEVFTLRRVDPQVAVLAINKLFGVDDKEKGAGTNAPRVESDASSRQLFVRGTPSQVTQVRSLLTKMGESDTSAALPTETTERGNVRTFPLSGRQARTILEEAEALWPVMRPNRIRVVRPSSDVPQLKTREESTGESPKGGGSTPRQPSSDGNPALKPQDKPLDKPSADAGPAKPPVAPPPAPRNASRSFEPRTITRLDGWNEIVGLVAWQDPSAKPSVPPAATPAPTAGTEPAPTVPPVPTVRPKKPVDPNAEPAEIVIVIGQRDLTIASEDLDALDEFEELIRSLADRSLTSGSEPTVFYLRYANAEAASALLQEVLGGAGGAASGDGGGGGSLFGDIASSMLGDMGGGLLGGLLGGGGGGGGASLASSGSVSIIPDPRLNALFVKAGATDLELIEQLLKVIDQEGSPEDVQTSGKPRFIPILNTTAEEVATIVRQVFANRLTADASQPRQPSPEDLVRALRGGGGGRGGSRQQAKSEPAKMTIGVDTKSNALIVSAPEPLFNEVKALVEQLDYAAEANRDEAIRTVVLKGTNPQLIQRALQSLTGGAVRVNSTSGTTPQGQPQPGGIPGQPNRGGATRGFDPAALQQMIPNQGGGRSGRGGGGRGGFPGGAPF